MPLLLVVGGIVLCYQWTRLLGNHITLLAFRFEYLRQLEKHYGLVPVITDQTEWRDKHHVGAFTSIERGIPLLFIGIYAAILIVLLVFGVLALGAH